MGSVNNVNIAGEGRNGDHRLSKFSAVASFCLTKCHGARVSFEIWFCIRFMQVISWRSHIPCFSWCLEKDRDLEQAELLACMPHSPCGARFEESKPAPRVQEACSDKLRLGMWIFDCNGLYGIYVPILCFWMLCDAFVYMHMTSDVSASIKPLWLWLMACCKGDPVAVVA